MSEEQLAGAMARAFGMTLVSATDFPKELPFRNQISRRFLMEHQVLPLGERMARSCWRWQTPTAIMR